MQVKLCYFNGHWNVYIYTPEGYISWIENPTLATIEDGDRGQYRLIKYNHPTIPIHSFGLWLYNELHRPGHGGEWSSNSKSINKVFGTDLWEVAVDQMAVAVPISWLKGQLGDRVAWQPADIYGEIITNVKGETNEYGKWVELKLN